MSKRKRIFTLSLLITAILAVAAVICIAVLMNDKDSSEPADSPATLDKTADYGSSYIDSMIFLGDYTSLALSQYTEQTGVAPTGVWTSKGSTLDLDANIDKATVIIPATGEEMLISSALSTYKPRFLVITLGIENAVPYCSKDTFCEYYEKLVTLAISSSPDTCVMLQSIFPVTRKYELKNRQYSNEKISECNTWISEIAQKHGVRYLNTAECLMTSSGALKNELASDSGNILNQDGCIAVTNYIRTHGYKDPEK